jgi:hypothetical protein
MLGDKTNATGMRESVVVYGNARVTDGGAVNLLQGLAPIYILGREPSIRRPRCETSPVTSLELRQCVLLGSIRGVHKEPSSFAAT